MKDYRIICELGEGGFGKVQLAERAGELCVIKRLKDEVLADVNANGRFMREAQLGAMLEHENIARLVDARFEEGELIVCTEFVLGRDLETIAQRLRDVRRLVPPEIVISVMLRVLDGLHYAHELCGPDGAHLGLVHRDVSPKN